MDLRLRFGGMKFLRILEKAWIAAAICSLVVTVVNLIRFRTFDNRVYLPLFCGAFCLLLWSNVRGQRRFKEKMFGDGREPNNK